MPLSLVRTNPTSSSGPEPDPVFLILPTAEVLVAAEAMLPALNARPLATRVPEHPAFVGSGSIDGASRQPTPARFNVLCWPAWGMCRFAIGHFLASESQAEAARRLAFGPDGTDPSPLLLRMEATLQTSLPGDVSTQIGARMHLLPPRPIVRLDDEEDPSSSSSSSGDIGFAGPEGLYCLTLVDERWQLRGRSVPEDLGASSWSEIRDRLAEAIIEDRPEGDGVSLTWEATDSHLPHPSLLDGRYSSLCAMIDAVAAVNGQRVVARLDGSLWSMGPASSWAARDAADYQAGTGDPVVRHRMAGGLLRREVL